MYVSWMQWKQKKFGDAKVKKYTFANSVFIHVYYLSTAVISCDEDILCYLSYATVHYVFTKPPLPAQEELCIFNNCNKLYPL